MKPLYLLGLIYLSLALSSCTATQNRQPFSYKSIVAHYISPPQNSCPIHKDPAKVALLTKEKKPVSSYKVIGKARVSKYNVGGTKRQEATIKVLCDNSLHP